ncbi:MAG: hypothetical protein JWR39_1369 [Devosia sp.]|jgi:hypothetical protein|nr:hypothetical protein [Devosia sp.]
MHKPSKPVGEPAMTTETISKQEQLPIPRGWIVLGFVGVSWGLVGMCVAGFRALAQAVL